MSENDQEIKQVSHQLGMLTASMQNMERQMLKANEKLECVHKQTIVTNESVKSAHKRLDEHANDHTEIKNNQFNLEKRIDGHDNIKWAAIGIFSFLSFSLGLLGAFAKTFFTGGN